MAEIREHFVEILNARVPLKDLVVYEPGCGDGVFTVQLAKVAKEVFAADARSEQVAATNDRVRDELGSASENVIIAQRDSEISYIDFDSVIDVTFHVGLLYHLNNPVSHLSRVLAFTKRALFLDTHYVHGIDPQPHSEDVKALRDGIRPKSLWLPLVMINDLFVKCGFRVDVIDLREERNGPRATLLAIRRGM